MSFVSALSIRLKPLLNWSLNTLGRNEGKRIGTCLPLAEIRELE